MEKPELSAEVEKIEAVVTETVTAESTPSQRKEGADSQPDKKVEPKKKDPPKLEGRIITIHVKDGKATLIDVLDGEEMLNLSFPDVPHRLRSILELNDAEIKRLNS